MTERGANADFKKRLLQRNRKRVYDNDNSSFDEPIEPENTRTGNEWWTIFVILATIALLLLLSFLLWPTLISNNTKLSEIPGLVSNCTVCQTMIGPRGFNGTTGYKFF